MSIRLRLTLLYSAILALTLLALGVGVYVGVSDVALSSASDALKTELHSVAISLQPHMGPRPGGGPGAQGPQSQPAIPSVPGQSNGPHPDVGLGTNIGDFIPPRDVTAQSAIQVRKPDGTVLFRSQDLQAAKITLPLTALARQHLKPGSVTQTTFSLGGHRLLLDSTLLTFGGGSVGILQVASSLRDVDQTLSSLWRILIAGAVLATLLACAMGWWLAGTALRPIDRITQTARAIGQARDFGRRVAYGGPRDEVGRLATTFNTMLAGLEESYQAQRRFVADASHELRTPLTSIRGNLGLLKLDPPIAEADQTDVVNDITSEAERLSRLVGDLLTLARNDAGRQLRQEPVPLQPFLASLLRQLAGSHPERTIRLECRAEVGVLGDSDVLTQVLLILLDNALKFTPAAGTVGVKVAMHGSDVAISVHDTGTGIASDVLPRVFDRFYQADTMRAAGGSGLGLAIAKSLVERQGGTIGVESEVGRGSIFTVMLPRIAGSALPSTRTRMAVGAAR
jgi:two-component system OmpR family sensor kinase